MDRREVLRPHSTDENGKPQGSPAEAATVSIRGKEETAGRIETMTPERDAEPGRSGERSLARLTELAKEDSARRFSSIAHLLTERALYEAFRRLRKAAAEGVDGITYRDYEKQATENIHALWNKLRNKTYQAQPLRRLYIPKDDGRKRPISIPSLEDKIVQRACVELLNSIYEADFLSCSYGGRPGRHPHMALDELDRILFRLPISYVLEMDIVSYFDAVVRKRLMEMIEQRVTDKSILRLIGKWISVGYIDEGRLLTTETGIEQGQVISPLLANVYLHHVLDRWFDEEVQSRCVGNVRLVRYVDDAVMCFEREEDAQKVLAVLAKRFGKYGLALHPEKTRLVKFGRRVLEEAEKEGRQPETFDFLGFTHISARSRRGKFALRVKTTKKRLRRSLKMVAQWCRNNRHQPLADQHAALNSKLRGHYQYYGRVSNLRDLRKFYDGVSGLWRKWLNRRTRCAPLVWDKYNLLLGKYPLELPRITRIYASLGSLS